VRKKQEGRKEGEKKGKREERKENFSHLLTILGRKKNKYYY
jgi:hypothetical protein